MTRINIRIHIKLLDTFTYLCRNFKDGLVPLVAREVNDDVSAGNGDSGAGQDTSLNVPQENEVAVAPEEERSSGEEENLSLKEESQPLRRSTRNRRPPGQYRDGTYLMYPQIVTTAQWKAEFDVLWSRFPEKRLDIYQHLIKQVTIDGWIVWDDNFCWEGRILHPGLLGLIALPTESPGGGFDYDRINVFFYDIILHQAGMHVRGMFGYVWHDWRN